MGAGRSHIRDPRLGVVLVFLCLVFSGVTTWACSVPVFRYALERWPPSTYEAMVFYRGTLTAPQQVLVSQLDGSANSNRPTANIIVRTVNLETNPPPELLRLWRQQTSPALPTLLLRYPPGASSEGPVWVGPLNEETVIRLLNSPTRRRIAESLLQGCSAVWVLLESGDKSQDDQAARQLQTRLKHLEKTLPLPVLEENEAAKAANSKTEDPLKVAFSLERLARHEPAEQPFIQMLLGVEDDLAGMKEPMAIPVFGRGRALYALTGKGINDETIDEACTFLIGPCSCIVKEQNPGLDLLLAVDWDSQVRSHFTTEPERPELTGLSSPASPPIQALTKPEAAPPAIVPANVTVVEAKGAKRLHANLLIVVVFASLVVLTGSLLLWKTSR